MSSPDPTREYEDNNGKEPDLDGIITEDELTDMFGGGGKEEIKEYYKITCDCECLCSRIINEDTRMVGHTCYACYTGFHRWATKEEFIKSTEERKNYGKK